jgi:uncharacterized protein YceH (UPF0502 family)
VLIEKAKTTPDYYPMTVAGICAGCNQKSCRHPLMQLQPEDVEEALERLRELGAVGFVEGGGRALKYRHYAYEWFGVNKAELAVLAELLLRGPQTLGQLRAHVSRMEPMADLSQLRTILAGLKEKGLVISLTPETRGHVVAHALYLPKELEKIREQYAAEEAGAEGAESPDYSASPVTERQISSSGLDSGGSPLPLETPPAGTPGAQGEPGEGPESSWQRVLQEIALLRAELGEIREEVKRLGAILGENGSELAELRRRLEQLL